VTANENPARLPFFEAAAQFDGASEMPVVVSMPTGPVIASDGLPARLIKPHTVGKVDRHGKYVTIFNSGMKNLWPDNRGYLELFASTGLAVVCRRSSSSPRAARSGSTSSSTCSSPAPKTTSSTRAAQPSAANPSFTPPPLDSLIRDFIERADQRGDDFELLTPRELEVLKLIAEGHTSKDIATMLVISVKTVDQHRTNMLDKLGMHDRVGLTRYAIRRGLIEP
jgi:DNA-binding CsgD family transcriptional regulator